MVLHILRALFILLMAAVGWFYVLDSNQVAGDYTWLLLAGSLVIAVFLVCIDILAPRRKLAIFSGTFLGLVVGILIAYGLSFAVKLIIEQWQPGFSLDPKYAEIFQKRKESLEQYIVIMLGVISCYFSISFIMQTKDDFRFIIPYVEFKRQIKGTRPVLLDTSVLIDGRVADIAQTGILEHQLIVPQFVLVELQSIADSADNLRRKRGRRGLDVLSRLRAMARSEVIIYDSSARDLPGELAVDQKLMNLATELDARVLTTDFNLNKVAQLRGVDVINVNDLANALKPVVLPGERMHVRIIKAGDEPRQGVGYLDDGTMVVVEHARQHMNEDVEFAVTSVLQTSAGKMIFGRLSVEPDASKRSAREKPESSASGKS